MEEFIIHAAFVQAGIALGWVKWKAIRDMKLGPTLALYSIIASTILLAYYTITRKTEKISTNFNFIWTLTGITNAFAKSIAYCRRNLIFLKINGHNPKIFNLSLIFILGYSVFLIMNALQSEGMLDTGIRTDLLKSGIALVCLGLFDIISHSYLAFNFFWMNRKLNVRVKVLYTLLPLFTAIIFAIYSLLSWTGLCLPSATLSLLYLLDLTAFNVVNQHICKQFTKETVLILSESRMSN
jgi:hypothetical protein